MLYNFGGVSLFDKLEYFIFMNKEIVQIVEKLNMDMVLNLSITFLNTKLDL